MWIVLAAQAAALSALLVWYQLGTPSAPEPPPDPRPLLAELSVDHTVSDGLTEGAGWLDHDWVTEAVVAALRDDGTLAVPPALPTVLPEGRSGYRLRVQLIFEGQPLGGGDGGPERKRTLRVVASMQAVEMGQGKGEAAEGRSSVEEAYLPSAGAGGPPPGAVQGVVGQAVKGALRRALLLAEADRRPLAELSRDARAGDRQLRVAALRALGERREPAVLPIALEALRDEDQDVVLAAVGALVALNDRSAVSALIESTRGRNTEYLSQVLFAVASLGGPEAQAYLDTLSEGHQSAVVRERARQALQEQRSRSAEAGGDALPRPDLGPGIP